MHKRQLLATGGTNAISINWKEAGWRLTNQADATLFQASQSRGLGELTERNTGLMP
jgi:hypothetical protein